MSDFPVVRRRVRYRHVEEVVDALLWTGDTAVLSPWMEELGSLPFVLGDGEGSASIFIGLGAEQKEVVLGDWIIRREVEGPGGDAAAVSRAFTPCKPELFERDWVPITVEYVPSAEAVAALFSGEHDDLTAEAFIAKFPPVEKSDPFQDDASRAWASRLNVSAVAARAAGFPAICVFCGAGQPGAHLEECVQTPLRPDDHAIRAGSPKCHLCDFELWVTESMSGCPNPRCPAHETMPRTGFEVSR